MRALRVVGVLLTLTLVPSAWAQTLVDDTTFSTDDWLYVTPAPNPSLTGGDTLVMDTDPGVLDAGADLDRSHILRYLPAQQALGVGESLKISFDVSIGSNFRQFHRDFMVGFFSLYDVDGPTANQTALDWPDNNFSSVGIGFPVFNDERLSGKSKADGRRWKAAGTPWAPTNSFGAFSGDDGNLEDAATPSMATGGEVYTVNVMITRLDDIDLDDGRGPQNQLQIDGGVSGVFGNDDTPIDYARPSTVVREQKFTNVHEYEHYDGIFIGTNTDQGPGNEFDFTLDNVKVELITGAELLAGDANGDGQVDGNDLISVEENFGGTGDPGIAGDANGDGQVDGNDLISVEENFGNTSGGASVPEPSSMILLSLCGAALLRTRR